MSREILFRGQNKDNKEWSCGFLFGDGLIESSRKFIGGIVIEDYKGNADDRFDITGIDFCEVIPETIGQYTGLHDSTKWEQLSEDEKKKFLSEWNYKEQRQNIKEDWNGRKIFEGDIVRSKGKYDEHIGVIKFLNAKFYVDWKIRNKHSDKGISCRTDDMSPTDEVIGNIFDNPELLKGETDEQNKD